VIIKILVIMQWKSLYQNPLLARPCDFTYREGFTIACFDGVASSDGNLCGAGGFLKINGSKVTKWLMNCGQGTNTKVELLGVWASLTMVQHLQHTNIQLLGDSKVVID
jgi:ribonuclease HI